MAYSGAEVVARVQAAVRTSLERLGLLGGDRPLVVAVSGGADSSCLLDALAAVVSDPTQRLVVGHVDHQIRSDSASDADHVLAAAQQCGVRCEIMRVDVPALATAERRGMEEAARLGRYRALRTLGEPLGGAVILTGHTRDDSVETVLMHLLRGSGLHGLGGISEVDYLELWPDEDPSGIEVVRPLLRVSRADTAAYCMARDIRWLTDPTNSDPRMLRNRVRHHLLPVLRTYNPAVDDTIGRLSAVLRDEEAYLHQATLGLYRDLVRYHDNVHSLDLQRWSGVPIALQRRIVRLLAQLLGHPEIGLDAVTRALAVGTASGPPRAELGGGIVVKRVGGELVFERPRSTT